MRMSDEPDPGAVTEHLAVFATQASLPDIHVMEAGLALSDTVAVSLAAKGEPAELILRAWRAETAGTGRATSWTDGGSCPTEVAAFVNGHAGHLLDYDDVSPSMPMHPSTVLFPALLAMAEARDISGERMVVANGVGQATFRAVTELLPSPVHYGRGWHTTGTVGRIATVAALANLIGLDIHRTRHALGLVSSFVGASRANFGTMTKPLHAGAAARDGVAAVQLAERGFTANTSELEARGGFFDRFGDLDATPPGALGELLSERLDYWYQRWVTDWGIKLYPACYATHRAIFATQQLREADPDIAAKVASITITSEPGGHVPLIDRSPSSATEAKFSAEYAVAVALRRGEVQLADFTPQRFEDQAVHELMGRASLSEDAVPPFGGPNEAQYTTVQLRLTDGSVREARADALAAPQEPIVRRKVVDCCTTAGWSVEDAEQLHEAVMAYVRGGSVSTLTSIIRRGWAGAQTDVGTPEQHRS